MVLLGDDGADPFGRDLRSGTSQGIFHERRAATQRAILFGDGRAAGLSGQRSQPAAIARRQNQCPLMWLATPTRSVMLVSDKNAVRTE